MTAQSCRPDEAAAGERSRGHPEAIQYDEIRSDRRYRHAAWASMPSRPISWSAGRSCCRTASASRCGWSCSPRAIKADEAKAAGADEVGGPRLGREDQRRLDRFRRLHRRPRHDGRGRPAGQGARPARPDAFAASRHRHARRRQGGSRNTRPARSSSATMPAAIVHAVVGKLSFDEKKLAENIPAFIQHILAAEAARREGTIRQGNRHQRHDEPGRAHRQLDETA